ncbi:hypothetical protein [Actinomadura flavalba]|uniref:hypothetical protein n=1 Tax=Actinomadura flavalba TaxID=1120938 RepID=UPI0003800F7B|nr:hypothetical protein [Actinomadura flavalba]
MTSVVTAGGVSVTTHGVVVDETETVLSRLVSDGVPRSLGRRSTTLWGPDAASLAARRLGWLDAPGSSRELAASLGVLAEETADLTRVVLAGTGGSVPAAAALAAAAGAELTVLSGTDPQRVAAVLGDDLERTLVVLPGDAGGRTVTDALRRVFEQAFWEAGVSGADLARRFVAVAEPGSAPAALAQEAGYRLVTAEPDTGGRFGALGPYALVPAALAGVDVDAVLDDAAALLPALDQLHGNPALALGAALGAAGLRGRDKLVLADHGSGLRGLPAWTAQLLAESTGKDGRGLLPVVVEGVEAPGFALAPDMRRVIFGRRPDEPGPAREAGLSVAGPLGAQFLLWEYATAVAGRVLGVNPFDAPELAEVSATTAALLRVEEGTAPTVITRAPILVDGAVEVHGADDLLADAADLRAVFDLLLDAVPAGGYLAVAAYLDPSGDAAVAQARSLLAARSEASRRHPAPVTFGWGPDVVHAAGQYHRGGPQNGVFVQLTGDVQADLPVPGRPYTLGQLQLAQAFGDLRSLRGRRRPAVRLHLRDRAEGVAQIIEALKD